MTRPLSAAVLVLLVSGAYPGPPSARSLDRFEDPEAWAASASEGVSVSTAPAPGLAGRALQLAVDFHGGAGYAVVRRPLALDLPDNWVLSFWVRGDLPPNNLEVKLIDDTGENVWWVNRRDFAFREEWTEVSLRRRHVSFAWGPNPRRRLRRLSAIEFAVTAGAGGRGRALFDELSLAERPPERPYERTPVVRASASEAAGPEAILGEGGAGWRSGPGERHWIEIDFLEPRELGGLVLRWGPQMHAARYAVATSDDGLSWRTVRAVDGGNGGADFLALPETETRYLRLSVSESAGGPRGPGYELKGLEVMPLSFGSSPNAFIEAVAAEAPRGAYPRSFLRQQSYWTVLGVDGDSVETLLGEDGALEPWAGAFSIEPFVLLGGRAVSWADVTPEQRLEEDDLPLPVVTWRHPDVSLEIAPFATGEAGSSTLVARYRLRPRSEAGRQARLTLAVRPLQVNPPSQFLNRPGGAATVRRIAWKDGRLAVDGRPLTPLAPPDSVGVSSFDGGEIGEWLAQGRVPPAEAVDDPLGLASAALVFASPGTDSEREVTVAVPLHAATADAAVEQGRVADAAPLVESWRRATVARWHGALDRVRFCVPPPAAPVVRTLRSNLAYILINRDGPALQPGSRSYKRSWIRDGALTSSALLRLGHADVVKAFAGWFAPYQFPNGKVPCCVDARGADPVPEHDSHGELVFLTAEYWRFTRDRATLEALWPRVQAAVRYLEGLRAETRTEEFRSPDRLHLFGLLPPSISHEGYSDKPAYSYWDDFFALRGYLDAAVVAGALGREEERVRYAALAEEFRTDLLASIERSRVRFGVDFIPGAADRGDFDSTSTTIALSPAGLTSRLPPEALRRTFERYWEQAATRPGRADWDAYTPYEVRHIGAFVRLGWRARARALVGLFLKDRRPPGWNHWAEVVGRDARALRFIGDMPHGWVGSDFIRSVIDLFCWWREDDDALVLGAGLDTAWLAGAGVAVEGLHTEHGRLDLALRGDGERLQASIGPGEVPPGGLVVTWPFDGRAREALVNGRAADIAPDGSVTVRSRPAQVVVRR